MVPYLSQLIMDPYLTHYGIVLACVFGLVLGSFYNVCIYRIPEKKSIILPPSHCPKCGRIIPFYDNIPLFSYLILRGKCRTCKTPISPRYLFVELLTAMISGALFLKYGPSLQYAVYFTFSSALIVISFIDLKHKIIPDVISLPGIIAGILFSVFTITPVPWVHALIGTIGGGGFLYLVAVGYERITGKEGMGGGDIKLLAMIGAWLGWQPLPYIILISSLTGALIGGASILITRGHIRMKIPFGPFLALGTLIYLFFGIEIITWYYGFLK